MNERMKTELQGLTAKTIFLAVFTGFLKLLYLTLKFCLQIIGNTKFKSHSPTPYDIWACTKVPGSVNKYIPK